MRSLPTALAACLLAVLALARPAAADPLTPPQKAAVESIVHDYLLAHPEVIVQALKEMQQKQADAQAAAQDKALAGHADALFHDAQSPVKGPADADVTIVEFFDYQCPYCKGMEPSIDALLKSDPKVRLVLKELPVLGPASTTASRAALAAVAQGRYVPFHDALMAIHGHLSGDEQVLQTAAAAGLDVTRLKTDMASPAVMGEIQRNLALADALGIDGTPALVIGGHLVPGAIDLDQLKAMVAEARRKS